MEVKCREHLVRVFFFFWCLLGFFLFLVSCCVEEGFFRFFVVFSGVFCLVYVCWIAEIFYPSIFAEPLPLLFFGLRFFRAKNTLNNAILSE